MDVSNGGGRRAAMSRDTSPERAIRVGSSTFAERNVNAQGMVRMQPRPHHLHHHHHHQLLPICRRVQIVYYLSRNGQLEHPHFMELSQLPNQHLRLRDVMDRLTVLRGKGMPSLYSWSCKRSYKNGYVWNDLSENDVIYPADGAEYVLKGSEIIPGSSSDRFQQLRLSNRAPKLLPAQVQTEADFEEEEEEEEEDDEVDATGSAHSGNRCSRGVSTDELCHVAKIPTGGSRPRGTHRQTEIQLDDGSPPSSSSSDPAAEPAGPARGSVLMNLIACGSGSAVKGRKSGGSLHKGVVSRAARASKGGEEEVRFMSERPRLGNPQAAEKEYFSGSIILEASRTAAAAAGEPRLKKSSSYNEERSSKMGIGEECVGTGEVRGGVKGKCIPGRKKSSKPQPLQSTKN